MTELCLTILLVAAGAGWLINKQMNLKYQVNKDAAAAALSGELEERLKAFDERINKTWSTISSTKEELNAFKLQIGLKRTSL